MSASATPSSVTEKAVQVDDDPRWFLVQTLPCQLTADLSLPRFTMRDFLSLRVNSIVATQWGQERDIPLQVNGVFIGWGELEAAGAHLAVRITELP